MKYDKCEDWLDELRDYLDANLEYLDSFLKSEMPKAKFRISEGTYLAWIDLSAYGYTEPELQEMISKAGLYLEYASEFVNDRTALSG